MRRVLAPVVLAGLAVLSLAVHQQHHHRGPADPTSTATSPAPAVGPARPAAGPPGTPSPAATSAAASSGSPSAVVSPPPALPRDATQAAWYARYTQAAVAFLTDFARPAPTVTTQQWWAVVRPHLADIAVPAYTGTDPRTVPYTRVTGPAVILATRLPTDLLMLARVPTDTGYWRVEMQTDPAGIHVLHAYPETGRP